MIKYAYCLLFRAGQWLFTLTNVLGNSKYRAAAQNASDFWKHSAMKHLHIIHHSIYKPNIYCVHPDDYFLVPRISLPLRLSLSAIEIKKL